MEVQLKAKCNMTNNIEQYNNNNLLILNSLTFLKICLFEKHSHEKHTKFLIEFCIYHFFCSQINIFIQNNNPNKHKQKDDDGFIVN